MLSGLDTKAGLMLYLKSLIDMVNSEGEFKRLVSAIRYQLFSGEIPLNEESRKAIRLCLHPDKVPEKNRPFAAPAFSELDDISAKKVESKTEPVQVSKSCANFNNATRMQAEAAIFATGAFKNVQKGVYIVGQRVGQVAVRKTFKSSAENDKEIFEVFEESYFSNDLKIVDVAVTQFNTEIFTVKDIWINKPEVWFLLDGPHKGARALVEPFIENFQKFNSNTGWTTANDSTPWREVLQALSHFSYHASNSKLVLCNLQGGVYIDGVILTDPVIMSVTKEYGPTDLNYLNLFCKTYVQRILQNVLADTGGAKSLLQGLRRNLDDVCSKLMLGFIFFKE